VTNANKTARASSTRGRPTNRAVAFFTHFYYYLRVKAALQESRDAVALIGLGEYDEAVECCDKALEFNTGDAVAWRGKGRVLIDLRKCDEAIECFDEALALNPEDVYAWNGKGTAFIGLTEFDGYYGLLKDGHAYDLEYEIADPGDINGSE
jgi:tetratricopeptide (TPR) repeat protein